MLDECSQMTEPASLLPIARFEAHKLVLVGDPKQLSPTIQGSEASHQQGLEQTMFDRLAKMVVFKRHIYGKLNLIILYKFFYIYYRSNISDLISETTEINYNKNN